jgi:tetratricopeptide (TPR) repeat protein
LSAKEDLAECYSTLGRHAEALQLTEETLAGRKKKLGPVHELTLRSMSNLAGANASLGRHEEALRLAKETLALQTANLGADDAETLRTMNTVGEEHTALGHAAEALKVHQETLALRKAKLRPGHPETLLSMWRTAEALAKVDRGAEAVPILDDCFRQAAGKHPDPLLVPGLVEIRLRHFQKRKDAAGCRATAEMWESLKRTDANSLYRAARYRAVAAEVLRATDKSGGGNKDSAAQADRAMEWLTQAVAAGYADVAALQSDDDLAPLRGREDFKKVLASVQAKKAGTK